MVPRAEPTRGTQRDARGHLMLLEGVQEDVGEQSPVDAQSFAEVAGDLRQVVDHNVPPTHSPRAAAAIPAIKLTMTFCAALLACRSSVSR